MKRAAILIGVDKTGGLPRLKDAAKGARRMEKWARCEQKMDLVVAITDEGGKPVEVRDITKAIQGIVSDGTYDQLLVYFAGHGVNVGFAERWLLSDAPQDSNAAVNLNGSAERAHHCGIPHVVFVSDACRTAAEGIEAQGVEGSIVFPNQGGDGPEQSVDRFWACLVGNPAAEIRDIRIPAAEYEAVYTGALLDALAAKNPEVTEVDGASAVVRPKPLKRFLREAMAQRLKDLNLQTKVIQVPDARITSDEKAWIARVEGGPRIPPAEDGGPGPGDPDGNKGLGILIRAPAETTTPLETISTSLLRSAVGGKGLGLGVGLESAQAQSFINSVDRAVQPFGPAHFETECGFKVRGARLVEAFSRRARATVLGHELVRVENVEGPGGSVLLVFGDGSGAVLPAIPGFITALTIEDGGLVDVAYEPSDNTRRWDQFRQRAADLRTLRAIAASSTKSGVFRLEGDDALNVAQRMQYAKGVDPTLAVYAAYAYLDLRRRDRVREMSRFMRDDLGARLFDVAMLAGELDDKVVTADQNVLPFFPLLSQGWALVSAHRVKIPAALDRVQRTLLPTVWTMFNPDGVKIVREVIQSGEVR